jgi:hypothetical protein
MVVACGGGDGDAGTPVFGGGGQVTAAVADLMIDAPVQVPNTPSSTAAVTVTAVDAGGRTLAGVPVVFAIDNGGTITAPDTTGDNGQIQATLSIGSNRSDRMLTVTATSGSVKRAAVVQVIGTRITATLPPVVDPGAAASVQYRVVDRSGTAMASQDIQVSAPGLTPASASGKTGPNGEFSFGFTAPAAPGSVQIVARVGEASDTRTLQVQPASQVDEVAKDTKIAGSSVLVSPSVVAVNTAGNSTNRAEVRALFLSDRNAPIKNVRVRFTLPDPNNVGGAFSTGATTLYTDANGVVTTAYIPGTRSSPTDGVVVRACYGKSDTDPDLLDCTTYRDATLTVANEALGVSIGTNELIVVNELTYVKRFLVSVTDSAGAAKPDVDLSVSLNLQNYRKGYYVLSGDSWAKELDVVCPNEDLNRNGVSEALLVGREDADEDGRLEPGRSDLSVRLLEPRTAADGTAVVEILYAKSFATWIDADLTVAASGVGGSEGRATFRIDPIPADAGAIKNRDVFPAFGLSPFGVQVPDAVEVETIDGDVVVLCGRPSN